MQQHIHTAYTCTIHMYDLATAYTWPWQGSDRQFATLLLLNLYGNHWCRPVGHGSDMCKRRQLVGSKLAKKKDRSKSMLRMEAKCINPVLL